MGANLDRTIAFPGPERISCIPGSVFTNVIVGYTVLVLSTNGLSQVHWAVTMVLETGEIIDEWLANTSWERVA